MNVVEFYRPDDCKGLLCRAWSCEEETKDHPFVYNRDVLVETMDGPAFVRHFSPESRSRARTLGDRYQVFVSGDSGVWVPRKDKRCWWCPRSHVLTYRGFGSRDEMNDALDDYAHGGYRWVCRKVKESGSFRWI